ncbi:uncharacterized protein LOC108253652, partial [Diaphorina citri]|uniref:Uncharacterized protein LOC108253652 n=1 Tax=Diaphorina citri TaxID=121845 RepID=A0A1S4EMU9_DIACI
MEIDTEDATSDSFVPSSGVSTGTSTRPQSLQLPAETSYSSVETQEMVMSVFWRGSFLGAACYCFENSQIYLLADIRDEMPDFKILESLFRQIQPSRVITCGTLSYNFINKVKQLVLGEDEVGEDLPVTDKLHFLSSKVFGKTLMSQPTKDRHVIESRLEVIRFCLESRHAPVVKNIRENIGQVQCVSKILTHMKNGLANVTHWLNLHK